MNSRMKRGIFFLLFLVVVALGILHHITPGHYVFHHDTYRRLGYFPITIGGILFGLPGGILFALLSCAAYIPHLLMFWAQGPQAYYSELSEILFYLAAGLIVGLISSRQARLQQKYKILSEQLSASYQRLQDQARQLIQAEEQLSSTMRLSLLGQVSASLAHEIKNPLGALKGVAEILEEEVPKGHAKHEFIDIMKSQISRLNDSVEKVLAFCRGQQVKESNREKTEPVIDIIQRVCTLLSPRFEQHSISVSMDLKPGTHPFSIPGDSMTQVLMNLLLNAMDAAGKGGKIEIRGRPVETGYKIEISDSGPGIDAEIGHSIFEPFVTSKKEGTGLGLFISRKIINRLGGTLSIAGSKPGGACFVIQLPYQGESNHKRMEDAADNFADR